MRSRSHDEGPRPNLGGLEGNPVLKGADEHVLPSTPVDATPLATSSADTPGASRRDFVHAPGHTSYDVARRSLTSVVHSQLVALRQDHGRRSQDSGEALAEAPPSYDEARRESDLEQPVSHSTGAASSSYT